ncbi:DUF1365 domain-containing protein [Maricaulis parjimensis]|uniref:DUF1365 domain-containing protein n=1 Tax=Maricaulis parjimensis TaxID=144023 RepID=UPI00193A6D84|nr:DUF1365 domain-containing protein [Maricaulis parjimensis]
MTPLPASLYVGDIAHMRHHPVRHALRYRAMSILADIDGPHRASRQSRLFSFDRFNLLSHFRRDHGAPGADLRDWVCAVLEREGIGFKPGRIQLLAAPRWLGLVFNPVSVFFCHDEADQLRAVLFEVSNFHSGRHAYAFPVDPETTGSLRFACPKAFFVSPFNPVEGEYRFRLDRDANSLRLGIQLFRDGECVMGAVHLARARPLTTQSTARALRAIPANTITTVFGILLEALRLRLKGLPTFAPRRGSTDTMPESL